MDALDFDLKEIFDDENDENSKENDDLEVSTPKLKAIADQPKKGKPQRKPQPKLDPQKLISEKGILQLPKLFETVKFKGKGHEAEDLKRILQTYELWAYRLFPKMPFDDFIERAEKLGEKREVKTCLKRIRMGVFNDDNADQSDGETNKNDEFEMDIALEKAIPDDDFWSDSTTRTKDDILMPPPSPVGAVAHTDTAISEDQMDRMARNRALALEKKRQRDRELALTKLNPYEETPTQCQIIPDSASTVNTFNGDAILEIEEKMATEDEILKDLDSAIPEETPKETPEEIPEETPDEIQTE